MRQRGDGLGFGLEAVAHRGVRRDVIRHHLDRDVAVEPGIARPIHFAHPPRTKGSDDLVLGKAKPGC